MQRFSRNRPICLLGSPEWFRAEVKSTKSSVSAIELFMRDVSSLSEHFMATSVGAAVRSRRPVAAELLSGRQGQLTGLGHPGDGMSNAGGEFEGPRKAPLGTAQPWSYDLPICLMIRSHDLRCSRRFILRTCSVAWREMFVAHAVRGALFSLCRLCVALCSTESWKKAVLWRVAPAAFGNDGTDHPTWRDLNLLLWDSFVL